MCSATSRNKFKNTTYVLKWKDNNHRHENSLDCLVQKLLCTAWFILSTLAIVRLKSVCMIVIVHISTQVEFSQNLFVSSLQTYYIYNGYMYKES